MMAAVGAAKCSTMKVDMPELRLVVGGVDVGLYTLLLVTQIHPYTLKIYIYSTPYIPHHSIIGDTN